MTRGGSSYAGAVLSVSTELTHDLITLDETPRPWQTFFSDWMGVEFEACIRGTGKNRVSVVDALAAWDTETTSLSEGGDVVGGVMYVWAFAFEGRVYVGRTWEEYKEFRRLVMARLHLGPGRLLFVWVHNLSFDFQFLRRRVKWKKIFATKTREVVEAIDGDGFCYKCSYKLTLSSLARCAEDLALFKIAKMSGDLDYSKPRCPLTPLAPEEWGYVTHDVLVVNAVIFEARERAQGKITKIPYTATGYVRADCYNACCDGAYISYINKMRIDYDVYVHLKHVLQGGFTHSSVWRTGQTFFDVASRDIASSYPTVLIAERYPMECFKADETVTGITQTQQYAGECWYAEITLRGVYGTEVSDFIISASKCTYMSGAKISNGRVIQADVLTTWITNVDLDIINGFYHYDSAELAYFHHARAAYLPKRLVLKILEYYNDKTKQKTKDPVRYRRAKALLNSIFGMFLTDPVNDVLGYDGTGDDGDGEFCGWTGPEETGSAAEDDIAEYSHIVGELTRYNNSRKRFGFWPWGIWVTAYARRNVTRAIKECGEDYIYCDTDSVKILNFDKHKAFFDAYNAEITQKVNQALTYHGIDPALAAPEDDDHVKHPIGIFDDDGSYKRFKTLGAKRYMYQAGPRKDKKTGAVTDPNDLYTTVAGCGKEGLASYLWDRQNAENVDAFDLFADDLTVPSDRTGKLTHTYGDYRIRGTMTDYMGQTYDYDELSWVHLGPCEYHMGLDDEFAYWVRTGSKLLRGVRVSD